MVYYRQTTKCMRRSSKKWRLARPKLQRPYLPIFDSSDGGHAGGTAAHRKLTPVCDKHECCFHIQVMVNAYWLRVTLSAASQLRAESNVVPVCVCFCIRVESIFNASSPAVSSEPSKEDAPHATSSPRVSPATGWCSLEDVTVSSSTRLRLLMPYVIHYFIARKAADGLQSADFHSLSDQSYSLYSKAYVREAEVAVDSDELFFRCKVRATMKSGVRYNVKVVLGRQSSLLFNTIMYTECSCPAGAAPNATCKHIAAVCYGLDE